MNVYMIGLWVLGACLVVGGTTILVLTLATKLFYSNITSIKAGADFSAGQAIAALALVTWDETTIRADEAGNFVKWESTTQFQDSATSPFYTYDLLPCEYASGVLPASNIPATASISVKRGNNGGLGVTTTTNTYIGNIPQTGQLWVSFPHLKDPRTVMVVGSGPVEGTGTGFSHRIRCENCGTTAYGNCEILIDLEFDTTNMINMYSDNSNAIAKRPSRPLQPGVDFGIYVSDTQISSNCLAYTYTGSYTNANRYIAAYLNGNVVQLKATQGTTTQLIGTYNDTSYVATPFASSFFQPYVGVGDMHKNSTVYAILVFNKVLTPVEIQSLSVYLQAKYFGPAMAYPTEITAELNSEISVVNGKQYIDADPITSYEISPALPLGLTFDITTGALGGAATVSSPLTVYTITARNGRTSSQVQLSITVPPVPPVEPPPQPPNIVTPVVVVTVQPDQPVTIPPPDNSGDPAVFTVQPDDTGLKIDPNTGSLSGTVTAPVDTTMTITAQNDAGTSTSSFQLQAGLKMSYTCGSSIVAKVGESIPNSELTIINARVDATPSGPYILLGNLFGLVFDSVTGSIGGTPTSAGSDTITVSGRFSDGSSAQVSVLIDIAATRQLLHKTTYLSIAVAGVGLGLALLAALAYIQWKTETKPVESQ